MGSGWRQHHGCMAPFAAPLPSKTSKTSITQQSCLCQIPHDAREFHISVHISVRTRTYRNGTTRSRGGVGIIIPSLQGEQLNLQSQKTEYLQGRQHTTPASKPQQSPWPQATKWQRQWGLGPHPASCGDTPTPGSFHPQQQCLWTQYGNTGTLPTLDLQPPPPFSCGGWSLQHRRPWVQWMCQPFQCPRWQCQWHQMGKVLTTPEAQAVTTGVLDDTLTEVLQGAKCQFSNVTRGSSGKRNQKLMQQCYH